MIDIVCRYLVIHSAKTITILHLYIYTFHVYMLSVHGVAHRCRPPSRIAHYENTSARNHIEIRFSRANCLIPFFILFFVRPLQCSEEIHQLVLQVENLVKPKATNAVLRPAVASKNHIAMDSSKNKRVAQWLKSHPSAIALPLVATANTDCEASCEYTTGKANGFFCSKILFEQRMNFVRPRIQRQDHSEQLIEGNRNLFRIHF